MSLQQWPEDNFDEECRKDDERRNKLNGHAVEDKTLSLDDFYCYMPMPNSFIFIPTREIWPAASVNARIHEVSKGSKAKSMVG